MRGPESRSTVSLAVWLIIGVMVLASVLMGCGDSDQQAESTGTTEEEVGTEEGMEEGDESEVSPAPLVIIRLSEGRNSSPLWMDVTKGKYQIPGGANCWEGSSIGINEELLDLYPGLAIDIGSDGLVLQGNSYSQGTRLIVDQSGNLVEAKP